MLRMNLFKIFGLICVIELSLAAVIRTPSPSIDDKTREDFERQVRLETEEFLNNIFTTQIGFFNKVKVSLDNNTQRYQDIEIFVEKLQQAKEASSLDEKNELYRDSFEKINKHHLLLNENAETGLDDVEYQKILEENGIRDLMKNFLADVTVYFWKMAKHSGKVVESAVDRFVDNMQKDKVVF